LRAAEKLLLFLNKGLKRIFNEDNLTREVKVYDFSRKA
jgi:hypothetical protein